MTSQLQQKWGQAQQDFTDWLDGLAEPDSEGGDAEDAGDASDAQTPDAGSTPDPPSDDDVSTPQPDGTGGCSTEAERRAQVLMRCLDAATAVDVPDGGWGPLAPYVLVLEDRQGPDPCEMPGVDYNGPAGWTDPCEGLDCA